MIRRDFFKASLAAAAASALPSGAGAMSSTAKEEFPEVSGLTRYVAEFVLNTKYDDIPREVIELGRKSILDSFGLALAGSVAESGPISRKYIQSLGICEGKSTVIGSSLKSAPRFAAFVNGVSSHADDYDDTQLAVGKDRVYGLLTHPTSPVLPAAFAIAEVGGVSGKELMLAYHLGVEVECKIAEAISPRHYQDGFHSSGTCGSFGSAAACAKLRGLDFKKTSIAFGIAASQAAGLRESFGTMTKPFHAGHAAENGVAAADLAALGWTAAEQILEAGRGFFHAYGGTYDPASIQGKLGKPWTFVSPGISIKPYPCGSLAHPAMTALERLVRENKIAAAQIEKVDVGTNHNIPNALIHHRPQTGLEAKFSMEYCISILLLEPRVGLAQFTDAAVRSADVQEMIRRVNFYVDAEAEQAGFDKMTSIVKVHLKDGRTFSGREDFAKGSPTYPMSFEDIVDKFKGCAEYAGWPAGKTQEIVDFVGRLERAPDVGKLSPLLTGQNA
jgi:2-methylcitrate dehydratase PrpD